MSAVTRLRDLEALTSGFNTNVNRDLLEQRGTRVSREEAFDSLGSFLGCLHRISSAQLAILDSVRDRLIDLWWNPRLTLPVSSVQSLNNFIGPLLYPPSVVAFAKADFRGVIRPAALVHQSTTL